MRKIMLIMAGLLAAMMTLASGAAAQVPGDDVQDPYFQPTEEPTEEPTDGGGVAPGEETPPPREEPPPVSRGAERPSAQLAETGMTVSVGLALGIGLLAAGGGLLLVSRRRKSALQ